MAESGKCKKAGRHPGKYRSYAEARSREKNKLKRIMKSNGRDEAEAYAKKHALLGYFTRQYPEKRVINFSGHRGRVERRNHPIIRSIRERQEYSSMREFLES